MTAEELEKKLTSIYHEFAETIPEDEPYYETIYRSKKWFTERLSKETDDAKAIDNLSTELTNCIIQACAIDLSE